jgi:hypothetical protein
MKHCECCTKKAQLKEKIDGDLLVLMEWLKSISVHAKGLGTKNNTHKKICIDIEIERAEELIASIVYNGKYKRFTPICNDDSQA